MDPKILRHILVRDVTARRSVMMLHEKERANRGLFQIVLDSHRDKRLGISQTDRATILGLPRSRIMRWDRSIDVAPDGPTHVESTSGQWRLRTGTRKGAAKPAYQPTPGKTRPHNVTSSAKRKKGLQTLEADKLANPPWEHRFNKWVPKTRPEHKATVLDMYERLGAQLEQFDHWED